MKSLSKEGFWTTYKKLGPSIILDIEVLMRVKILKSDKTMNDKIKLKDLLSMHPLILNKVESSSFEYSDLIKVAEWMFISF